MREFTLNGILYRTNADATVVEAQCAGNWRRTFSLRVLLEARRVLGLK